MSAPSFPIITLFVLVGVAALLSPATADHSDLFDTAPSGVTFATSGTNVILPCRMRTPDQYCSWMNRRGMVFPQSGKYEYDGKPKNGDCSMLVKNVTIEHDNDSFTCQVQGPAFNSATASVKLFVVVKPSHPVIDSGDTVKHVVEGKKATVNCTTKGGNPVPNIEWNANGYNITNAATVVTSDNNTTTSTLAYNFTRQDNKSFLMCRVKHSLGDQDQNVLLNVAFKPEVSINVTDPNGVTVDQDESIYINCNVQSNPEAKAIWKTGHKYISTSLYKVEGNMLVIKKATRDFNGITFECSATNSAGMSKPAAVKINVLFPPELKDSSPLHQKIQLNSQGSVFCHFKGNPKPKVHWFLQSAVNGESRELPVVDEQHSGELLFTNMSYKDAGTYTCDGRNYNRKLGREDRQQPQSMSVEVYGRPEFLQPERIVTASLGFDTLVTQTFCSNPFPSRVFWVYNQQEKHVDLKPRDGNVEFVLSDDDAAAAATVAELSAREAVAGRLVSLDAKNNDPICFSASLKVRNTDVADQLDYQLVVVNKFGQASGIASLKISTLFTGAFIITVSLVVLIFLFLLVVLGIFLMRRHSSGREPLATHDLDKGEAGVPMTDDVADEKKADQFYRVSQQQQQHQHHHQPQQQQIYANLDFNGDCMITRTAASSAATYRSPARRHPHPQQQPSKTHYAQIVFAK